MNLPIIPNFPKEGINFIDIFPLFQNSSNLLALKAWTMEHAMIEAVAIPEARGFLLAGMFAAQGVFVIPFRKKGKLPGMKASIEYGTEYSKDTLEFRPCDINRSTAHSKRCIIADDILATGGTAEAMASALEEYGVKIEKFLFLAEVPELKGRERLEKIASVEGLADKL